MEDLDLGDLEDLDRGLFHRVRLEDLQYLKEGQKDYSLDLHPHIYFGSSVPLRVLSPGQTLAPQDRSVLCKTYVNKIISGDNFAREDTLVILNLDP